MHVRAQAPAQRGVEQMGRGVVALGGVAGGPIDLGVDALAGLEVAVLGRHGQHLIVCPGAGRRPRVARQPPDSHSIVPTSAIWPPPVA